MEKEEEEEEEQKKEEEEEEGTSKTLLQKLGLYVANLHFGNPKREYKLKGLNLTNLIIKA